MSDELKGRLERLGERAPDGRDAIERLRDAREHRDRRRRGGALVVGLSIVLVGAIVAASTLRNGTAPVPRDDDPVVAAWQVPETPYLWPENWARPEDRELLSNVQAAADEGSLADEWRLDPKKVVARFLTTVLAWDDPYFVSELDAAGEARAWGVAPPCPDGTICDQDLQLIVTVVRPAGGQIWSIGSVSAELLQIGVGNASPFSPGEPVLIDAEVPEARAAHAGFVASNGCGEAVSEFALAIDDGESELVVPDLRSDDPSCGDLGAGYLFAYAMDDTTVPTGDPLLEAAAIEYPWLTIVPVTVQMVGGPEPAEPAPAAIVECSGPGVEGTKVLTPVVAAQADGVHVEVRNTSGVDLGISFARRGDNADVGTTELLLDSPPGAEDAICVGEDTDVGADGVPFEIVDPEHHWLTTELAGEACSVGNLDYGEEPEGLADPVEAARDALGSRVEPGDELALAGYPEATVEKVVVLSRDGVPIMSVEMFEGTRGWYAHTVTDCS